MDDEQSAPRPVRFRAVIELSFPDFDPSDPDRDFGEVVSRFRDSIENNPSFHCKEVRVREILSIGDRDDYEDWRSQRGNYAVPEAGPGIGRIRGVTYPAPPVSPADLASVWTLQQERGQPRRSIEEICEPGANIEAVMGRVLYLRVLREIFLVPDWSNDGELAARVFEQAAVFEIDQRPTQADADRFMRLLNERCG
jgi:hypothetical protein